MIIGLFLIRTLILRGNLGREATLFDVELSYRALQRRFGRETVCAERLNFFPQEGKYHWMDIEMRSLFYSCGDESTWRSMSCMRARGDSRSGSQNRGDGRQEIGGGG